MVADGMVLLMNRLLNGWRDALRSWSISPDGELAKLFDEGCTSKRASVDYSLWLISNRSGELVGTSGIVVCNV